MKNYVHAKYDLNLYFTVDADLNEVHDWKVNGDVLSLVRAEGEEEEYFPAEAKPSEDQEDTKPLHVEVKDEPFFENQGKEDPEEDPEEDDDNEEEEDEEEDDEEEDEPMVTKYEVVMFLYPGATGQVEMVPDKYLSVVKGEIDFEKYEDHCDDGGKIKITKDFVNALEDESKEFVNCMKWCSKQDQPWYLLLD